MEDTDKPKVGVASILDPVENNNIAGRIHATTPPPSPTGPASPGSTQASDSYKSPKPVVRQHTESNLTISPPPQGQVNQPNSPDPQGPASPNSIQSSGREGGSQPVSMKPVESGLPISPPPQGQFRQVDMGILDGAGIFSNATASRALGSIIETLKNKQPTEQKPPSAAQATRTAPQPFKKTGGVGGVN